MIAGIGVAAAVAGTLDVGAGQPYATIAEAVAASAAGDELVLHDAAVESIGVRVPHDLTFRSAVGTTWRASAPTVPAVEVEDGTSTIDASIVLGDPAGAFHALARGGSLALDGTSIGDAFLQLAGGSGLVIQDATVLRFASVIALGPAATVEVRRTTAEGDVTVHLGDGSSATVEDSAFRAPVWFDVAGEGAVLTLARSTLEHAGGSRVALVECRTGTTCALTDNLFLAPQAWNASVLSATAAAVTFARNRVCDASTTQSGGTLSLEGGTADVRNNLFRANAGVGAPAVLTLRGGATATFEHNDVLASTMPDGVPGGVVQAGASDTITLAHNLVAWSAGAPDAALAADGAVTEGWSAYFDNSAPDAGFPLAATSLVGVDPELVSQDDVDCTFESVYRWPTSPLRDAGDPARPEADGTPPDLGALGGAARPTLSDADADGFPTGVDCDDADPANTPAVRYEDRDGDGVGRGAGAWACEGVAVAGDCDDRDPTVVDCPGTTTAPTSGTPAPTAGGPDGDRAARGGGCGCRASGGAGGALPLGLLWARARRRDRAPRGADRDRAREVGPAGAAPR